MKERILIISLTLFSLVTNAQVVDTSEAGVDIFLSTSSDTFYSEFNVLAGVKVSGHDSGIVYINAPTEELVTVATTAIRPTTTTDVILELVDSMNINLDESDYTPSSYLPQIKGGLFLGFHSVLNNSGADYTHFADGQEYRYTERFDKERSYLYSPNLKNTQRDSFAINGSGLFSMHMWDNKTESFVTGYVDADSIGDLGLHASAPTTTSSTKVQSTGKYDITTYDPTAKTFQHHVYKENAAGTEGDYVASSENFGPVMDESGKAYALYYGNMTDSWAKDVFAFDSIHSVDGFHDGDIEIDITNESEVGGRFSQWHLIGNPYKESIRLDSFMVHNYAFNGSSEAAQAGYYGEGTVSIYTDVIQSSDNSFEGGYVVVNKLGEAVGLNNFLLKDNPSIALANFSTDEDEVDLNSNISQIAPGQAFFVFHGTTKGSTVKAKFTNSMRMTGTDLLLKKASNNEINFKLDVLRMDVEEVSASNMSQLAVTISDEITPKDFDAIVFKQDYSEYNHNLSKTRNVNIYTQNNHEDIYGNVMKAVSHDMVNKLIPLGFESKVGDSEYAFFLSSNLNNDLYDIYVVDRLMNVEAKLTDNKNYKFSTYRQAAQQNRFFLKFKHKEDETVSVEPNIYFDNENIFVNIDSKNIKIENLSVIDVAGRIVKNISPNTFEYYDYNISSLPTGVYFIKVKAGEEVFTQKIVKK